MKYKDKLPLIVGIAIPILLIIYVLFASYIPSLYVKPQYDFIYSNYDYDNLYTIVNGKITYSPRYVVPPAQDNIRESTPAVYQDSYKYEPVFYYYSQDRGSRKITLTEVQTYNLDPSTQSPDGFTVGRDKSGDGGMFFPFFYSGYDNSVYLRGKGLTKKVAENNYDFKLVGWVLNK